MINLTKEKITGNIKQAEDKDVEMDMNIIYEDEKTYEEIEEVQRRQRKESDDRYNELKFERR